MKIEKTLPSAFARLGQHEEYEWKPLPWKGIYNKVLFFDRVTGATMELARVEKGCEFPQHYHPSVQTLFLVSGRLRTGDSIIQPGTFNVIPAGQVHGPFYAEEEAIQFKYFSAVPIYFLKDGNSYVYRHDGSTIAGKDLNMSGALAGDNFL